MTHSVRASAKHADAIFDAAVEQLRAAGAVTEATEIPGESVIRDAAKLPGAGSDRAETIVRQYEFKADLNRDLESRPDAPDANPVRRPPRFLRGLDLP